jgi:hypothetical protein
MYEVADTNGIHFRAHQPSSGKVLCIIVETSNAVCILCRPPVHIQKAIFLRTILIVRAGFYTVILFLLCVNLMSVTDPAWSTSTAALCTLNCLLFVCVPCTVCMCCTHLSVLPLFTCFMCETVERVSIKFGIGLFTKIHRADQGLIYCDQLQPPTSPESLIELLQLIAQEVNGWHKIRPADFIW